MYPLRRFPVSFAIDTGTFGYSQVQHLFAHSFYRLSIGNSDSGPHVDHAHQFNVVVYGDCDDISIHATRVGSDNSTTTGS